MKEGQERKAEAMQATHCINGITTQGATEVEQGLRLVNEGPHYGAPVSRTQGHLLARLPLLLHSLQVKIHLLESLKSPSGAESSS